MKNPFKSSSKIDIKFLIPILVAIIVLFSSAIIYYNYEERTIKNEKYAELRAIAQLKKDQLVKWRAERLSEAAFFPAQKQFIEFTKAIIKNPEEDYSKDYFNRILHQLKNNHNYQNIFITGSDGKIYFTLDTSFVNVDSAAIHVFKKSYDQKKILINDFYYCNTHNEIHLDFVSPILDESQNSLALLVFRIDPKDYLFPVIDAWPLPSSTGESILLRVEDQNVIYLSPLLKKNDKLTFKNSLSETDFIAVKGALGKTGIVEGKAYNGKEYLADISLIDKSPWFLVSQIELSEVYSELRFRAIAIAIVVLLSLIAFTSGIMLLYKYKQSSLYKKMFIKEKELSEAKEEFKTALYSIGDGVITTDTNGYVKHMNFVAEKLTGYTESESKGKKIEDIFKIIAEDSRNKIESPIQKIINEGAAVIPANHSVLISKNKSEIPISISGSPIKDNKGSVIGIVLVFRDQTSERSARKKLKESEEQFRLISDLTTDYLFS
ncbi:MAG TPA: PAS domain S-box protein, partial [Ignavibacteriaceae bacterium]